MKSAPMLTATLKGNTQYKNHLVIIMGIFHRWNHVSLLSASVLKTQALSFEERISSNQNIGLETDPEGKSCYIINGGVLASGMI